MNISADELKAEGNKAFGNQEYKKAAKIYRDAIKLDPSNPVLYSNRAQCFIKLQDFERAVRDCTAGLNLTPPKPLQTKLNFRKGLAHKNLGDFKNAETSFREALQLDPSNSLAQEELKALSESNAQSRKKAKIGSSGFEIPIEDVSELPQHFRHILDPLADGKPPSNKIEEIIPSSQEADKIADEIFKDRKRKTKPQPSPIPETPFVERSTMHFLAGLKSLPYSQKSKGYQYVIQLNTSELKSTFASTGIDAEFLNFYLEAVADCLSQDADKWKHEVLEKLQFLSTLKRFALSLDFCRDEIIASIISYIGILHDPYLLQNYRAILNG